MARWLIVFSIVVVAVFSILRFMALEKSPPGFFVDEASIATQVICLRQSGTDYFGKSYPLFGEALGGGLATPAMLYGGGVWSALFGDSISSFRAFSALHGVLTIVGVYFLTLFLWRRKEAAWLAALCCAISPWGFLASRIAWDPPLAPAYLTCGLALFFSNGRWPLVRGLLSGLFISLAAYSYPPMRMQVLLLFPAAITFAFYQSRVEIKQIGSSVLAFGTSIIPLAILTLNGELQGRFNMLSITNEAYLNQFGGFSVPLVIKIFLENIALNLSPKFLFIAGDSNLRHATGAVGQWSWIEAFALAATFYLVLKHRKDLKKEALLLLFILWAYCSGIVPAAMTWESNPHALRSIGSYPFISIFSGIILAILCNRLKFVKYFVAVIVIAFSFYFFSDFFKEYPKRSYAWYDTWIVELANHKDRRSVQEKILETHPSYPELARRYHELRHKEFQCQRL